MKMATNKAAAPSRQLASLLKIRLSLFIALSALLGFVLHAASLNRAAFFTFASVFSLAGGAAIINNVQDRRLDRRSTRTRHRPLAAQTVSVRTALALGLALISAGASGLWLTAANVLPAFGGLLAVLLYNGLYTPLKRQTLLALIPGTACGMLPPWLGWLSAGGSQLAPDLILIMVILGIWQLPHFWLLFIYHAQDYQQLQIPSLAGCFPSRQGQRVLCCWISSFAVLTLLMPLFAMVSSPLWQYLLAANAATILWWSLSHLRHPVISRTHLARIIMHFNASLLLVIISGIAEKLS